MPEGPQVARYARLQRPLLVRKRVRVDSPSGKSDDAAAFLDGRTVRDIAAVGKHLLYRFGASLYLHVHLGRFGSFRDGPFPEPPLDGIVRLRLRTANRWLILRGAAAVDVYDDDDRERLLARIGPNPLEEHADPSRAFRKLAATRTPIGVALMDQSIVAGVGNIYRSEALFLRGIHPRTPANELSPRKRRPLWNELRRLMLDGEVAGRIVTTWPRDRSKPNGPVRRADRFYVYHRTGLPCRRCGTPIEGAVMAARSVFWCPRCQPETPPGRALMRPASPSNTA